MHGNPVQPKLRLEQVTLHANVALAEEDGDVVIATEPGRPVLEGNRVSVHDQLEIAGDVDFESGNIDVTTEVSIRGKVRDLFEVRSKKSVLIGGVVEAATVVALGDVLVRGGVFARGKGLVRAGGNIAIKLCDEANIRAGGDIQISREAINSHLYADGRLQSERGAIIGGEAYAYQGAEVYAWAAAGACRRGSPWVCTPGCTSKSSRLRTS